MKVLSFLKYSLFLIIAGIVLIQPAEVQAQTERPSVRELLEQRDKQIKELLGPKGTEYTQEQRQKLKKIINGIIDYRSMAAYALQETYDTLSTEQRNEFVELFSSIVRDQSLNNLDIYRADVVYKEITVNGDSATVRTLARLENVRTPVSYDLFYKDKKGQWVITDLIIDDVSTAASYRRQFQNIIRRKGYDSLIETLRERAGR